MRGCRKNMLYKPKNINLCSHEINICEGCKKPINCCVNSYKKYALPILNKSDQRKIKQSQNNLIIDNKVNCSKKYCNKHYSFNEYLLNVKSQCYCENCEFV